MNPGNYHPFIPSPRDWPEDASHENGSYMCSCTNCGLHFTGHKRRYTCHVCHDIEQTRRAALTPEERAKEEAEFIAAAREILGKLDKGWRNPQDTHS